MLFKINVHCCTLFYNTVVILLYACLLELRGTDSVVSLNVVTVKDFVKNPLGVKLGDICKTCYALCMLCYVLKTACDAVKSV